MPHWTDKHSGDSSDPFWHWTEDYWTEVYSGDCWDPLSASKQAISATKRSMADHAQSTGQEVTEVWLWCTILAMLEGFRGVRNDFVSDFVLGFFFFFCQSRFWLWDRFRGSHTTFSRLGFWLRMPGSVFFYRYSNTYLNWYDWVHIFWQSWAIDLFGYSKD